MMSASTVVGLAARPIAVLTLASAAHCASAGSPFVATIPASEAIGGL